VQTDPPGIALSRSFTNILWALGNLMIGYLLFRIGKVNARRVGALVVFFIGVATISVILSILFARKDFMY
jgi:hypothetical protein